MAGTKAEKLPVYHAPRVPRLRRPHGDRPIWAALGAAGVLAVGVTVGALIDAGNRLGTKTEPAPAEPIPVRLNPPDKKTMEYPYGEPVNLTQDSSGIIVKFNGEPQLLKAITFNVEEGQNVIFTNNDLENPQEFEVAPDRLMNDYFVPFFGDGDKPFPQAEDNQPTGDIWLMRVNANREPIGEHGQVLPEGTSPIYTRIDYVNLNIPEAPQEPMLGY